MRFSEPLSLGSLLRRPCCTLALLALGAPACGPKPAPNPILTQPDGRPVDRPPPPAAEDEQLAQGLVDDAAKLATAGDARGAAAKEDQVLSTYPATLAAAKIYKGRAESAEKSGAVEQAVGLYEKLLFYRPDFPDIDALRERYADLLTQVGRPTDAANMLRALFDAATATDAKERLGGKLAAALVKGGAADEALLVLMRVLGAPDLAPAKRDALTKSCLDVIDSGLSFKQALALWDKVKNDSSWASLQPALAFKIAKVYYHVRDFKKSEEMLGVVATRFGTSPFAAQARDFAARLKGRFQVSPRAIGVLLPLSGQYELFGKRSLAAIQQAFAGDTSFTLVVKDTQADPNVAGQAVEDAVMKDHVIAIIGPLFAAESMRAAQKAEELSVPMLTLSWRPDDLPRLGPYVFRTALTVQAQAQNLARFAFEQLGLSRFALLCPRNSYGTEFARAFWDEVDRRKGEIRGFETYEIDQTTFMEPVKKLVGRYYTTARREYFEGLAAIREKKLPPHRVQAELEKLQKTLPPVVDFDAIIIPDPGPRIGLIVPALAFEDIITTHDPKEIEKIKKATNNPNVRPVYLLGASTWNSPQILTTCERYCEGAIFVDAYYPDNPEPRVREFITSFRETNGIDPTLAEAQAHDTAGLMRWIVSDRRPADRSALLRELESGISYEGVTGRLQFDAEGDAKKDLFVLTIEGNMIKRWEPPAESPQG